MKDNTFCLLLTGTIAPRVGINRLERRDAGVREEDYYRSIKAWMELGIRIVFCENSDYQSEKISDLFENYTGYCEYLKFQADINITEKGRGEAEILSFCYSNSRILAESDFVVKCTGRLHAENFSHIIKKVPEEGFSFVYADLLRNMTWANSMFFMYDRRFYAEYLKKYLEKIDEAGFVYFEHALARAIHASMADGFRFSLLPYPVEFSGYHGSSNELIKNDIFRIAKRLLVLRIKRWAFQQN